MGCYDIRMNVINKIERGRKGADRYKLTASRFVCVLQIAVYVVRRTLDAAEDPAKPKAAPCLAAHGIVRL